MGKEKRVEGEGRTGKDAQSAMFESVDGQQRGARPPPQRDGDCAWAGEAVEAASARRIEKAVDGFILKGWLSDDVYVRS